MQNASFSSCQADLNDESLNDIPETSQVSKCEIFRGPPSSLFTTLSPSLVHSLGGSAAEGRLRRL